MNTYHLIADQMNSLAIATDYSSVMVLKAQETLTGSIGENMLQFVMLVSHGLQGRSQLYNVSKHFWAVKQDQFDICSGHYHSFKCYQKAIDDFVEAKILEEPNFNWSQFILRIFSDGAWGEQKNRFFCMFWRLLAIKYGFKSIIHTFAPTACFKWLCDTMGYVAKHDILLRLIEGKALAFDDVSVYAMTKKNPPHIPNLKDTDPNLMTMSGREHFLTADKSHSANGTRRIPERLDAETINRDDPNVLYFDSKVDDVNCKPVLGISKVRQLRVSGTKGEENECV